MLFALFYLLVEYSACEICVANGIEKRYIFSIYVACVKSVLFLNKQLSSLLTKFEKLMPIINM